jgi:hypothetical protein
MPIEDEEGKQLDPPRVEHIAADEGPLLSRTFQAAQRAGIGL